MKAALMGFGLLWAWAGAWAQAVEDIPGEIRQQRERLSQERSQINQAHELQAKACWQKFAVNDCLAAVRKSKRAQLDPIHQQELQLNAQERAWRTQQREQRLREKDERGADQP